MATIPSELVDSLLRATRALGAISAKSMAHIDDLVTPAQWRVLVILHVKGSTGLTALAQELDIDRSSASRTCEKLVAADYVHREDDPDDRRNVLFTLTPTARRILDDVRVRRERLVREALEKIDPEHWDLLRQGTTLFADAIGELESPYSFWGPWR